MKAMDPAIISAIAKRTVAARDFLWIVAKDPSDDYNPVSVGFWSDLANVTASVIDPDTGSSVSRAFYGAGSLIAISDIPSVAQISTDKITIDMSQLHEEVEKAVRLYYIKQARVEIFRGYVDPKSGQLVAPAEARFVGYIDHVEIITPSENEEGSVRIEVANHSTELLRSNPATRSHEDQQLRYPGDDFFIDAAVVGEWGPFQWGPKQVSGNAQKPKGLFGWNNFLGFL